MIDQYLEDVESRIDPEVEEALWSSWTTFADNLRGASLRLVARDRPPPGLPWPHVPVNATLESYELMALQQLSRSAHEPWPRGRARSWPYGVTTERVSCLRSSAHNCS